MAAKKQKKRRTASEANARDGFIQAATGTKATKKKPAREGRPKATDERLTSVSVPVSLVARLQRHAFDRALDGYKPVLWQVIEEAMNALEKGPKRKR